MNWKDSAAGKFVTGWFNTSPLGMIWNIGSDAAKAGKELADAGRNYVTGKITQVTKDIKAGISNTITSSNVYDGGFAGMSETAVEEVKADVKKYIEQLKSSVSSFDDLKEIDTFLKGETNTAAHEYVQAMKDVMGTYLESLNDVAKDIDAAYQSFKQQSSSIASATSNSAQDLRAQAANKPID